ncbi:MAG: T9SS type A sorting domain-containing protein [Bacteroidota bacterium]|jgi:hypothetical protein
MKKTITKITLAITAIVLLGFNQVNAQAQRRTNIGRVAFFNQLQFASQPINASNTNGASLGKKATKQRLDSIVNEKYNTTTSNYGNGSKSYSTYDFNGRILTSINILWNDTFSNWQNNYKSVYAYNVQGYRTLSESYDSWDRTSSKWQSGYKTENTFDNKGNQTSDTYYNWDVATQTFSISQKSKTNFILNSNGKPTISYDSSWNTSTNTYDLASKTEYSYDANGNITLTVRYYFDGTTWNPSYKTEYTYNTNNKVLVELQSNFSNGNWTQTRKYERIYDANRNQINYIEYNWNTQTNIWDITYKNISTYDANNNQTSSYYAYLDNTTKLLVNERKNEFTYDGNGNINTQTFFSWDKNTNQWVNNSKLQINYNNNYAAADIVWNLGASVYKHMITGATDQKWLNNGVNDIKYTFYYSANNFNGVKETETASTNIFPNPTSGIITISSNQAIAKIDVIDITGKMVQSQTNSTKQNYVVLDLSALNNGIYFINAQNNFGGISKSKLVISK